MASASLQTLAALQLPFVEGFDVSDGSNWKPEHTWTNTSTSTSAYFTKWTYNGFAYCGSDRVEPQNGSGAFANIRYYSNPTQLTHDYLTSEAIDVSGVEKLDLSFSHYRVTGSNTSTISASISFDGGDFKRVYIRSVSSIESKWEEVSRTIDVPAGASEAVLRFEAYNGDTPETVIFDNVRLQKAQMEPPVYPSSVTDFTADMNGDRSAIDIALTAPTLTHPSLGGVHNEPLTHITSIVLSRCIGTGDYSEIHTWSNPAPGSRQTFSDTDLTQGGTYSYKAVVYVDDRCDYGTAADKTINVGQRPGHFTSLKATSDKGKAPVYLSFVSPAKDVAGYDLAENMTVEVERYNPEGQSWSTVKTWENIHPASMMSMTDFAAVEGEMYDYRVFATARGGKSEGDRMNVYVGADMTVAPTDVTATYTSGLVHLSWTAPAGGVNNGYVDFDNLTYKIYRGNAYSDYNAELIAEGVTDCTFIDPKTFEAEEGVRYFVKGVNMGYEGYSAVSQFLIVGKPSVLPYAEGFDKVVDGLINPDHSVWLASSSEENPAWAFAEMAYFLMEGQVIPFKGNGLAYAYYSPYDDRLRDDYLTSGHVSLVGARKPELKYHAYVVPGYDTSIELQVAVNDTDFVTVDDIDYSTASSAGWVDRTIDLTQFTGKVISLRFRAHKGENSCSAAIDEISIRDIDSGVAEILGDDAISLNGRTLSVNGAGRVAVSAIDGKSVFTGRGHVSLELRPGMYVVTADGASRKLMVR